MIVARAIVLIAFALAGISLSMLLFYSPYQIRDARALRPRAGEGPPPGEPRSASAMVTAASID